MIYLKNLINAVIPVLKYMILSYLVIFISYFIYILMGGNDASNFVVNYATYILILFNIIYIVCIFKKNRVFCKKTSFFIPFIMLGIGLSCFCNMVIMRLDFKDVVDMNIFVLIISSVIVGPLIEELIFRYLLVNNLSKFNNKIFTILIAGFIFAIMHNGVFNIIYAFLLGIILNTIYLKNKNLFYPLIVHSSANLVALFFSGYNVYILGISFVLLIVSMFIVKRDYLLK